MILLTTFFVNVLCAIVPCPPQFPGPEIADNGLSNGGDFVRRLRNTNNNNNNNDSNNSLLNEVEPNILETDPKVRTGNGDVEGYFMKTVGGRNIYSFEGIPYAEPPVGYRRFQPPVPKASWKRVLQAKRVGQECLQYNPFRGFRVTGNEDCLFLNIYTPQIHFEEEEKKFPVIVWIHGGFYNFGAGGEYGPSYLLEKNVVLVTINYRLGVLGFLSTGDKFSPGNNGLKDQALAIEWVAKNIENFGGDKDRVTLMGFSAGGSSVHFHMLANRTRNYFQQGISLSGTAFNPWAIRPAEEVQNATIRMAESFRCPTTRSKDILNCLSRQTSAGLVARQSALFPRWPYPYVLFGPVLETTEENPDAFLTESPHDTYARNGVKKVPWIATMTKQEGHFAYLFPSLFGRMNELHRNWNSIAPDILVYAKETNNVQEVTDQITKFYFKDEGPLFSPLEAFSQAYTDRHFGTGLHKALKLHSPLAPTYAYLFNFMGKYNMGNLIGLRNNEWGVGHAEDTFYIFNSSSSYTGFKKTDPEFELSSIMVNLICNFVRGSEPLYTLKNSTNQRIWDRIEDVNRMPFLQLASEVKMVSEPHQNRLRFWEGLNLTSSIHNQYKV